MVCTHGPSSRNFDGPDEPLVHGGVDISYARCVAEVGCPDVSLRLSMSDHVSRQYGCKSRPAARSDERMGEMVTHNSKRPNLVQMAHKLVRHLCGSGSVPDVRTVGEDVW